MTVTGDTQYVEAPASIAKCTIDTAPRRRHVARPPRGCPLLEGISEVAILDHCLCDIDNFIPYVGSLPAGEPDEHRLEAYSSISAGLKVGACGPTGMCATHLPAAVRVAEAEPTA